jgi:thiol-disulfide isomerase/thioredoxin
MIDLREKPWLIDVGLVVIIIVMAVFVVVELNRTYNFMRDFFNPSPTETPQIQMDATMSTTDQEADEIILKTQVGWQLTSLDGEVVSLSDFKGKPVLVNFWATWCPPCLAEMPLIQEYADRYKNDLVVLAINAGEDEIVVREFVTLHDLALIFLLDPANVASAQHRIYGYPTTLFFDADGILQATHIGELDQGLIERNLAKIGIGE